LNTFARKILFTRQALINDDMNALSKVPTMFGRAGSKVESDIVWGLLLNWDFLNGKAANNVMADGKTLFHADHKNKLTGAGSALSKTSLSNLRKLGRKQVNLDGEPLNMVFNTLVMPSDLETTAEELLFNNYIANVSNETSSFRNKFEVRIEERLAIINTIGLTAWYAFSNFIETFEYATLAGEPDMVSEVVNSRDADGMTVLARKDFGAGLVDHRGMAMSNGQ
jgi:phage major head subunit gpT-like protein